MNRQKLFCTDTELNEFFLAQDLSHQAVVEERLIEFLEAKEDLYLFIHNSDGDSKSPIPVGLAEVISEFQHYYKNFNLNIFEEIFTSFIKEIHFDLKFSMDTEIRETYSIDTRSYSGAIVPDIFQRNGKTIICMRMILNNNGYLYLNPKPDNLKTVYHHKSHGWYLVNEWGIGAAISDFLLKFCKINKWKYEVNSFYNPSLNRYDIELLNDGRGFFISFEPGYPEEYNEKGIEIGNMTDSSPANYFENFRGKILSTTDFPPLPGHH